MGIRIYFKGDCWDDIHSGMRRTRRYSYSKTETRTSKAKKTRGSLEAAWRNRDINRRNWDKCKEGGAETTSGRQKEDRSWWSLKIIKSKSKFYPRLKEIPLILSFLSVENHNRRATVGLGQMPRFGWKVRMSLWLNPFPSAFLCQEDRFAQDHTCQWEVDEAPEKLKKTLHHIFCSNSLFRIRITRTHCLCPTT